MLVHHGHVIVEGGDELVQVGEVGQLQVMVTVVLPHAIADLGRVVVPVTFEKTQKQGHVGDASRHGLVEDGGRDLFLPGFALGRWL